MKRLSTILILILALVLSSSGKTEATTEETVTKYNVDYCGSRECYIGAKDSYSPGKEVKMYYDERMISTDTNYSFYLDDEKLSASYKEGKGFLIKFTMPDHDVKLEVDTVNSMEALSTEEATEAPDGTDSPASDGTDPVTVAYASDVAVDKNNAVSVDLSTGDTHASLVFSTSREVKNIQILRLSLTDVDSDGNATFSYSIAHNENAITPDKPLVVDVTFWGDMPEYGIAYTDSDTGSTGYYIVNVSGMDGSVSLSPIEEKYLSETAPDNTDSTGSSSDKTDAAMSYYKDIIYMYKEAQTNGYVDHDLWSSLNMYSCLEGYGWPERDSSDEVTYSIYDINKDGIPELIISFFGYVADIYSYDGTRGVEALSRSYKGSISIYEDGLICVEESYTDSYSTSWHILNPTIGRFLPTVENITYFNDDGSIGNESYYDYSTEDSWDEINDAYKETGLIPVWAYEWGDEITSDEYFLRISDAEKVKDFPQTGLIMEFTGF